MPGDHPGPSSIGNVHLFKRNKGQGCESDRSRSYSTMLRMITALHIPPHALLLRTETTLRTRKAKYNMREERVLFHDMHYW